MNVGVEIQKTSYLINWTNIIKKQKQLYEKINIKKGKQQNANATPKSSTMYTILSLKHIYFLRLSVG